MPCAVATTLSRGILTNVSQVVDIQLQILCKSDNYQVPKPGEAQQGRKCEGLGRLLLPGASQNYKFKIQN